MFCMYFLVLLVFLVYLFDTLVQVFVAILLFFDKINVFLVVPHLSSFKILFEWVFVVDKA
jgi:hypothetical protein